MYRKALTLSFIFVVILLTIGYFILKSYDKKVTSTKITTSFYPLYVATSNILKDTKVEVTPLYSASSGCIHELNLSTDQMVNLNSSKILIINGAGMEDSILDKINQDIKIIDASSSISLLHSIHNEPDSHEDHQDTTHSTHYNPHYWLSISNYIQSIINIQKGLLSYEGMSLYSSQIEKNTSSYIDRLNQLKKDSLKKLSPLSSQKLYFLDESFKYFVLDIGVHAVFIPFNFHENTYSPSDLVTVLKAIKQEKIKILFVSEDITDNLLSTLQKDSDLTIYKLSLLNTPEDSSGSTGLNMTNSYINEYQKNIDTIVKALTP